VPLVHPCLPHVVLHACGPRLTPTLLITPHAACRHLTRQLATPSSHIACGASRIRCIRTAPPVSLRSMGPMQQPLFCLHHAPAARRGEASCPGCCTSAETHAAAVSCATMHNALYTFAEAHAAAVQQRGVQHTAAAVLLKGRMQRVHVALYTSAATFIAPRCPHMLHGTAYRSSMQHAGRHYTSLCCHTLPVTAVSSMQKSGCLILATCFWLGLLLTSKLLVEWGVSLTRCSYIFAHFLRDVVFIKMATAVHCCAHLFPVTR
jgi:hypothetical protein